MCPGSPERWCFGYSRICGQCGGGILISAVLKATAEPRVCISEVPEVTLGLWLSPQPSDSANTSLDLKFGILPQEGS